MRHFAVALALLLSLPLAAQAAPNRAPKPLELKKNYFGNTLLKGQIQTGQVVRGKLPVVASTARDWRISAQPHPNPGAAASAKIVGLVGPGGKPRIGAAGETVRFEATVQWDGTGDPPFGVALHTNANHAAETDPFRDYSMKQIGREGNLIRYAVDVPVYMGGTFDAKAVVVKDNHPLAWSSGADYRFHPYFLEHDRINEKLVHVANLGSGKYGTFEDMLGRERVPNPKGKYTLNHMRSQGVTAIRLLPFGTPGRANNQQLPYSRASFFDVCIEHSEKARVIRDQIDGFLTRNPKLDNAKKAELADLQAKMYKEALGSLRTFIASAHKMGIRVFVDYVANHTGPDVRMLDAFFKDASGQSMDLLDLSKTAASFEVRSNDPSQLAVNRKHLAEMVKKMRGTKRNGQPLTLQNIATHLYAKWGDGRGATNPQEIIDGGWGAWPKPETWQLNHGTERYEDKFVAVKQTELTRNYLLRDMAFLVLLGVDGFRLDHWNGMPETFAKDGLNKLQGVANKYRPGLKLFTNAEHFHRDDHESFVDAREIGGFKATMGAQGPSQFRSAVDASWRQSSVSDVGNHDEGGGIKHYGNNAPAFARLLALNALVGGPAGSKMLDEVAEQTPTDHRNLTFKPWGLFNTTAEMTAVSKVARNAGRAKLALPALAERQHDWLQQSSGAWHDNVIVAARYRTSKNDGQLAVVAANFNGSGTEHGTFQLTDAAKSRIKDDALYQGYNYMGNPRKALWSKAMTGRELKQKGVFFSLGPNETQVLDLREVRTAPSGGFLRSPRERNTLYTIGDALRF
jgi:hypothetical protein